MRRQDASAIVVSVCFLLLAAGCAGPRPAVTPGLPAPPEEGIRPRIGLALGGGGARGFAHIGALRVLEQEKIPIDLVVGTSVGSLVKGKKLEEFLRRNLKHPLIENMVVPFTAVAVDLDSGETVLFRAGDVAAAVHASCAIPGVFVPVTIGGRTYVDGGVTNPVPASVARELGAEVVIAMSVPPPARKPPSRNQFSVAYHAISIMAAEIGRLRADEADVVIATEVGMVDFDDFSQKRRLIEAGEAAARAALPAIRAAIAAKTRY